MAKKKTTTNKFDTFVLPLANGVSSVTATRKIPKEGLADVLQTIKNTNEKILSGNLHHLEDVLLNQIHALEAIFYACADKMICSEYLSQAKVYSEIALKSKKNFCNTVMALAELKNPKQTTFVKQQNNALNQQINHLEKNLNLTNELKEINHEPLDPRASATTITGYPQVEALGKLHRSENFGRERNQ